MPSDSGRRPKGVVNACSVCIVLAFIKAKEIHSPNRRQKHLTVIRGNAILKVLKFERRLP